jgi:4-amino-4-deoxy-L-arabinose transferase-like glycosyltransferase
MAAVQKPPEHRTARARRDQRGAVLLLLAGACILYGAGLGATDLWAPDEPRYAAIAEELRSWRHGASGLALLHLNGDAYTQKPPLYFWLAAGIGAPLGRVTEVAARLPSVLAAIACVALTAWIGRRLLGRLGPALVAAGVLATSFRFAFSARRAQLDVLLTALELAAIAIFVALETRSGGTAPSGGTARGGANAPGGGTARSGETAGRGRTRLAVAGLHAALGAAALVKGPVAWLPLLVFAVVLAWEGRLSEWRAIAPAWAWPLSLGPLLAWIAIAVALAPAGFAEAAVAENLIGRFFAGTSHARPFYYYAYQLPLDFLPWSLLLPLAVPRVWWLARRGGEATDETEAAAREPDPAGPASRFAARLLLVWIGVPLAFFSLSAGKRGLYLLPVYPALALVAAFVTLSPRDATASRLAATEVAASSAPGRHDPLRRLGIAVLCVAALELIAFVGVLPRLDAEKSPRPIATAAAALQHDHEPIGVYGMRPLEGALAYYGASPIESLRDEGALRSFLADGGRLVVLRQRHFEALAAPLELVERRSFRSGARRLTLAEHRPPSPQREDSPPTGRATARSVPRTPARIRRISSDLGGFRLIPSAIGRRHPLE